MDASLIDMQAEVGDRHWWFIGRRRILRALADRVLTGPGAEVVDLGCGVGTNTVVLADIHTCVGFDTSQRALDHARHLYPHVRFVEQDAFSLPDEARSADLFLLMDVLEHVERDRDLLEGVIRAAKPGAHVLLTVPAAPELWSDHDVAAGHVRRYEIDGFARLWDGLPVATLLVSHFNSRLFLPARIVRRIRRRNRGGDGTPPRSDVSEVPRPVNAVLEYLFAGERRRLLKMLDGGRGYGSGLSLIALLRRDDA